MSDIEWIIKRPIVTEKASRSNGLLSQGDLPRSQVVLEVSKASNKIQIQKAVEKLFSVKVESVRTMILPAKQKRVGRFIGMKSSWKKAIVTLKEGNSIDFFEGA